MTFTETPPASEEAEQSVLGCMVMDNLEIAVVSEILNVEDFYRPSHQVIFSTMLDMTEAGKPVDILTLVQELRDTDKIQQAGREAYIAVLPDCMPASSHAKAYANIVKDKAIRRNMISVARDLEIKAREDTDTDEVIANAQGAIFALTARKNETATVPLKNKLPPVLDEIDAIRTKKKPAGILTGYADIDYILAGLHPAELIILAGRPGMGKTTLALNIVCRIVFNLKLAALFFSLEMSEHALITKILCSDAVIDSQKVRTGKISEQEFVKIQERAFKRQYADLFIDDTPSLTTTQLTAKARRVKAEHDIDLVVVDYLQLMKGRRSREGNREQEISDISQTLKALAKELNIPVLALSQLNRKIEEAPNREPQLSHLRESGAIEQDADVVMFIWEPKKKEDELFDKAIRNIKIAKQRNGPTGSAELLFQDDIGRFENYER